MPKQRRGHHGGRGTAGPAGCRGGSRTPEGEDRERTTNPGTPDVFQKLVLLLFNLIRAHHHLRKIKQPPGEHLAPTFHKQVRKWLEETICPAKPKEAANLIQENADNWLQASLQILEDHHTQAIHNIHTATLEYSTEDWDRAWLVATKWIQRRFPHIQDQIIQEARCQLETSKKLPKENIPPQTPPSETPTTNTIQPTGSSQIPGPSRLLASQTPTSPLTASTPPTHMFTRHEQNGNKWDIWTLTPERRVLFIGDSNLCRIPRMRDDRIQVDSYPGAKINHAAHLLKNKTPTSDTVEILLLSFGINDRTCRSMDQLESNTKRMLTAAVATFPLAQIRIPLINMSQNLPVADRKTIQALNNIFKKHADTIPRIQLAEFQTEWDNIHWTLETGIQIATHWINSLDS